MVTLSSLSFLRYGGSTRHAWWPMTALDSGEDSSKLNSARLTSPRLRKQPPVGAQPGSVGSQSSRIVTIAPWSSSCAATGSGMASEAARLMKASVNRFVFMCSPAKSEEEGVVPLIPSVERPTCGPPFLRGGQGEERRGGTVYS